MVSESWTMVTALSVHLLFRHVITACFAAYSIGCVLGILVKKVSSSYHPSDRAFNLLFECEHYAPLLKRACLISALFMSVWSRYSALVLSVSVGVWTGCTMKMKQACGRFRALEEASSA